MNSLDLKAELASYWRFVRQMPLVAIEALSEDIIVVTRSRKKLIVEIKVSISDLKHDLSKPKHADIRKALGLPYLEGQRESQSTYPEKCVPNAFYFAIPDTLEEKARSVLEQLYPYAGLILVKDTGHHISGRSTLVVKSPMELKKSKLSLHAIAHHVKAQSASLANAYAHLREQAGNLEEFRDGLSLHKQ